MAYEPEIERLERRYQDDPARNFAQLAEAYRKVGRLDEALTLLQGHLAERPNYVSGLVVLGRCQLDQQNDVEARETFERVLAVDAEHIIALRALGEIAERGGDVAGAKEWFTRLLEVDPMNDDAEAALARLAVPPTAVAAQDGAVAEPGGAIAPDAEAPPEPDATMPLTAAPFGQATAPDVAPDAAAPAAPPDRLDEPAEVRTGEFTDDRVASGGGAAGPGDVPSEYALDNAADDFLPRESQAHPTGITTGDDLQLTSQLPEEASPLDVPASADHEEPFGLPTGEREIDLGGTPAEPEAPADAAPAAADGGGDDLGLQPFDDSLGWGAGDRISRQISSDDLQEIEETHQDDLASAAQELPGLEHEHVPEAGEVDAAPIEGLFPGETPPADVRPIEGLEPTVAEEPTGPAEMPRDDGIIAAPLEPAAAGPAEAQQEPPSAPPEPEPAVEFVASAEPAADPERAPAPSDEAAAPRDESAERRASLRGLPLLDGAEPPPDSPLVLDAQPEPVLTETMAELYVQQGLLAEAREVYEQLVAQRPGDAKLARRLAELREPGREGGTFTRDVAYAAAETGGQSVQALLQEILGTQPVTAPAPAPAPAAVPEAAVPDGTAASAAPAPAEPLDEAFADESADERPEHSAGEAGGAPTQPASDEVSLAAIFGEPAPKAPAPPPAESKPPAGRTPGGFSFDQFFGASPAPALDTEDDAKEPERRDSLADDEGEEAFRDWLKSLKG